MDRTFVIGLGSQKCGTTWLYNYLSSCSHFREGFAKEYHIWDAKDIPLFREKKRSFSPELSGYKLLSYLMESSSDFYFSYFDQLLNSNKGLAADITPSYAGLPAKTLQLIKDEFEKRGITVKCVFLMRDPIDRCISAVRMNKKRHRSNEGFDANLTLSEALREYSHSEHAALRTRYENTIENVNQVFDSEDIFFGIYENLFTEPEIDRLSEFLSISARYELGSVKVFANEGKFERFPDIEKDIFDYYTSTYEYCAKEFPVTRDIWYGNCTFKNQLQFSC